MKELFINLVSKVKAVDIKPGDVPSITPVKGGDLKELIFKGVNVFLWVAGVLAAVYLIYGGVLYITAGGDAEKATKGRTALINAIIGIVIILLSLAIMRYLTANIK